MWLQGAFTGPTEPRGPGEEPTIVSYVPWCSALKAKIERSRTTDLALPTVEMIGQELAAQEAGPANGDEDDPLDAIVKSASESRPWYDLQLDRPTPPTGPDDKMIRLQRPVSAHSGRAPRRKPDRFGG